jgi:hypothetical protein
MRESGIIAPGVNQIPDTPTVGACNADRRNGGLLVTPSNPKRNGRGPARFSRREPTRFVKSMLDAGLPVERVEVDPASGKITVFVGKPDEPAGHNANTEVENWINQHANKG